MAQKIKDYGRKVKFNRMNWDSEFYADMLTGRGFIIDEPAEVSLDGSKKKAYNGAQSTRYGTSFEDEQSFAERYRCQCPPGQGFTGKLFEGEICPLCGHKVEYRDSDINTTGWISFGDHKIINPLYYLLFTKSIGKSIFLDIITPRKKVDIDGNISEATSDDIDFTPLSPYSGKGTKYFYENYEEILDYFKGIKKNKADSLELLKQQKDKAFTSHVPIASTMLRPQSSTADTLYFSSIDKEINTLYSLSDNLLNCNEIEEDIIIDRIQKRLNNMWEIYLSSLTSKEGHIRGEILGGSMNYTSRNVIIPDPSLHDNEVDLMARSTKTLLTAGNHSLSHQYQSVTI